MRSRGKLGDRTFVALASVILFLLVIGGLTGRILTNQKEITAAQERRYQSYLLADELRQSSDDLTRLARTYVVTGDLKYEAQYWTILAIRNGQAPRPLNYERIYWDFMAVEGVKPRPDGRTVPLQQLMKEQGFTDREFALLKEAQSNSDGLVRIETVAMNAIKGLFDDGNGNFTRKGEPDPELARKLMHSTEYHADKAKIMKPIDEFFTVLEQRTRGEVEVLLRSSYRMFYLLLGVISLAILTVGCLYVSIFRKVIRPSGVMMEELFNTSHELEMASSHLAVSSHSLSSGASEQASSVEETSASLEEMSSMTRITAENARNATSLASETRSVVEGASLAMDEMIESMNAIGTSSAEVAKIVKNIDEIAFQTNILALNAAVEAARAGEAGAGFAVVADEVRSLAQRSAAAAKETAAKIEAAIASSRSGFECSARVGEALKQIAEKVKSTDLLVADIARGASEQSQGIEQINGAMVQLDKVTQGNATSAEESASAAEELDAQADALKGLVDRLRLLVGGNSSESPSPKAVPSSEDAPSLRSVPTRGVSRGKGIPMPGDSIPAKGAYGVEDSSFRNF
ncbi:MAG: methyl-accepting chemotaxis protein [Verrucomicrobiota bacterium]